MVKGSKLKQALDRFKGVDHKLDHQKKLQKTAEKRKRSKVDNEEEDAVPDKSVAQAEKSAPPAKKSKKNKAQRQAKRAQAAATKEVEALLAEASDASDASEDEVEETDKDAVEEDKAWETDDAEEETHMSNLARLADDSSDSDDDDEEDIHLQANGGVSDEDEDDEEMGTDDDDEDEDIALSDLDSVASEDKGDIIPYQRLTINNTAALQRAYKSFALSSKLPFSENQVIVSDAPTEIADVDDDLNRELSFYKQSLDALTKARKLLKKEGVSFSRPADYFAEMVKDDEHMGKIKQKLIDEAAGKRASADARRQRDLKKFGKQVQVAKLQERSKEKRDTMEKIGLLKRKRQGADIGNANEADLFDVALEDSTVTAKKDRADRKDKSGPGRPNTKRTKRDEKYGFGGKKRFAKSNDATSSADVSKFSVKKMKGGKKGASRPGKSRRSNKP